MQIMKTKNIFLTIFLFLMCFTGTLEAGWQATNINIDYYNCFYFTDANTGYAFRNNNCLKTTDGGVSWTKRDIGVSIYAVDFVDNNTGYAVGYYGAILKTLDAGNTWEKQYCGTTTSLYSVCFTNNDTGYAVGEKGLIIKTTNGGVNWKTLNSNVTHDLYGITFVNENIGYAIGNNRIILKTVDAGATWVILYYEGYSRLNSIFFTDENTGFVAGFQNIYKTNNGGKTWIKQEITSLSRWLNSIFFVNKNIGYVSGEGGLLYRTTDGGETWTQQYLNTTNNIRGVFFTDTYNGYVLHGVSYNGGILKTTTGGVCTEKPEKITGEISFCNPTAPARYTTSEAAFATSYQWEVSPTTAGTISSEGTTAYVTWNSSFTGKAILSVRGVDASGCPGETTSIDVYINNSGSSVGTFSLSTPLNGGYTNSTPYFQWEKSQGASTYNLYVDGKLIEKDIEGLSYQISQDKAITNGMHTWYVEASNGCQVTSNETWSFRVDDVPPSAFDLVLPVNDSWTTERQPTFTWNASGDTGSGLDKYQLWINGSLFADDIPATTNTFTPTFKVPNGTNNWQIKAVDKAGNVRSSTQTFVLNIDNTPPGLIEDFETGDFGTVFNWNKNYYSTWSVERQYNRDNEYSYVAKSGEINDYQSSDISFTIILKSEAKLSFDYKVSSQVNRDYLVFEINGRTYFERSGTNGGWSSMLFYLHPGVNTLKWSYVKDYSGSSGTDCAWIDNIVIDSELIKPLNGQYITSASQQFAWASAPDKGAGLDKYQLFMDDVLIADNLKDTVYTVPSLLSNGSHKCDVKAIDLLGNSRIVGTQTFKVDNAKPNPFNLSSPLNGQVVNLPTPDFSWEATTDSAGGCGLSKYQVVLNDMVIQDSVPTTKTSVAANNPLPQGKYTWHVKAYDKVGNYRTSNSTETFYIDWEDPLPFTLIYPASGIELGAKAEFKWHSSSDIGSGIYKYELNITGREPITILAPDTSYLFINDLASGNYTWSVKAYDLAGNYVNSEERTFSVNSFTVSVSANPPTGGIALGGGVYPRGTPHLVTASPSAGHTFTNWTENGTIISTESIYSFTVEKDRTLIANFTPINYEINVSANPSAGGTVTGGGSLAYGTTHTITANVNKGYSFMNWTENDTIISSEPNYTFTIDRDRKLVANFKPNNYTIDVSVNSTLGGTVTGEGVFAFGTIQTVTATANTGYSFTGWTENDTIVSTEPSYTFTVEGNRELVANFTLNNYTINVSASPTAGGTVTGGGSFVFRTTQTVTASANTGYTFANWTENDTIVSTLPNYTFTVERDRKLVANFTPNKYVINVLAYPTVGGTVAGGGSFAYGTSHTVTATANTGYTFTNWMENGTVVSPEANYTFTVEKNRRLTANFKLINYPINVSANPSAGGTVAGGGNFAYGILRTVKATANTGYTFTNWTENGMVVSTDSNYTFTIKKERSLVANFEKQKFIVSGTVSPLESGNIAGAGTYDFEDICILKASANKGYVFVNWTENETEISIDTIYSFRVTKDISLTANFRLNTDLKNMSYYNIKAYGSHKKIIIENAEKWTIKVIDVVGKTIFMDRIKSDRVEIPISVPGIYVIQAIKNDDLSVQKIVVEE